MCRVYAPPKHIIKLLFVVIIIVITLIYVFVITL